MDDLDLDILRWMYPGGLFSFWGADPRISHREIAVRVGLDRTAIWNRLRKWRREGFWNGFAVDLNLRTIGIRRVRAEVRVADSAAGWALVEELEHIDGVLWARVGFGDSIIERDVEVVSVVMVADSRARLGRRMRSLRQLSPTGSIEGPFRNDDPPCPRELTPLDWRIIGAIVDNPNASPSLVARLVGVTLKTFVHHHSALIDDRAVFYLPQIDWTRMGCVDLGVYCHNAQEIHRIQSAVEARFPHSIPLAPLWEFGGINAEWDDSTCFSVIVPARSPHQVQTIVRDLSQIEGVRKVRAEIWGPERRFPKWVDQRIAEHLTAPEGAFPVLVPDPFRSEIAGLPIPSRRTETVLASR